jgi:hypothetical protein
MTSPNEGFWLEGKHIGNARHQIGFDEAPSMNARAKSALLTWKLPKKMPKGVSQNLRDVDGMTPRHGQADRGGCERDGFVTCS